MTPETARATEGAPTVSGLPGSPSMLFEDPSLPHQIALVFTSSAGRSGHVAVSCNCLAPKVRSNAGRGRPRGIIASGERLTTAQAVAAYLAWHHENHRELSTPVPGRPS